MSTTKIHPKMKFGYFTFCFVLLSNLSFAASWETFWENHRIFVTESQSNTIIYQDQDCPKRKKECNGTRSFKDGSRYEGDFSYGEPHGKGTLVLADASKYVGEFQSGFRHGNGKIAFPNGDTYLGDWKNDRKHGKGIYTWADGSKYVGQYFEDMMNGKGIITLANGESFEGEWKENLAHGEGTYSLEDGSKHFGKYKYGKRNGSGVITWNTGDVFIGKWKDGSITKTGTFQFNNGAKYICIWEKGELIGDATYVNEEGKEIKGNLKEIEKKAGEDTELWESIAPNLSISWYAVALEYKYQDKYKEALRALEEAGRFMPPSSDIGKLIYQQTQKIQKKINDDDNS